MKKYLFLAVGISLITLSCSSKNPEMNNQPKPAPDTTEVMSADQTTTDSTAVMDKTPMAVDSAK